jgi:hypothetical protein
VGITERMRCGAGAGRDWWAWLKLVVVAGARSGAAAAVNGACAVVG